MKPKEAVMSKPVEQDLLEALLDSWDRNNKIMVNLLRAIPKEQLGDRAAADSPSVAEMFTHMHYVRLAFVFEDAPEYARPITRDEWSHELDPAILETMLNDSANAVREAVDGRLKSTGHMDQHYDHPLLFLQHMIWHEGYHHGQIKLALKLRAHALADKEIGPATWGIWIRKTAPANPEPVPEN
jgi:uncharacterized damage-inducible protein DinB